MEGRTEYWMEQVIARTKRRRRQRERQLIGGLRALCLLLTASLAGVFHTVTRGIPRGSPATEAYAAVMLHEGAGGYVLVGVLAFAIGAAIAIVCILWHRKQ
ncbi:MAG: hypothetical protein RR216_02080 [Pseudoflavonifractor sp.]